MRSPRVLILYTGGTFGMAAPARDSKKPLDLPQVSPTTLRKMLLGRVPELEQIADCTIDVLFNRDSAHLTSRDWIEMAQQLEERAKKFEGVVILHGTDTLTYSASALSFLFRPCHIPVILTGAQRPLASIRTDARRNLLSAVEIAAHGPRPLTRQISVYFNDQLFQGNRVRKRSASDFAAFESPKASPLAVVGTSIRYSTLPPLPPLSKKKLRPRFDSNVAMLHVTPDFPAGLIADRLVPSLSALVLVIFASGTAPTQDPELRRMLREARSRDLPVIAVTEDHSVPPGGIENRVSYSAGKMLWDEGCHDGGDLTPECAFIKTSLILGQQDGRARFKDWWNENLAHEGGSGK